MSAGRGIAVISGGGSGIGRAIALELARRGHALALLGRRRAPLEECLAAAGGRGSVYEIDVRVAQSFSGLAERIEAEVGAPEIVVAAAGFARVGRFVDLSAETLRSSIETNLLGAAGLFHAFLPGLVARDRGVLVPILSVAARRVFPGWSAYAASKWGLLGLVESLREELAGTGVRIVALTPGATDTELWQGIEGEWNREKMIPVEEVARALGWALESGERAAIEEIRIQPRGGNL